MVQLKRKQISWVAKGRAVPTWQLSASWFNEFEINNQCSMNAC